MLKEKIIEKKREIIKWRQQQQDKKDNREGI